MNLSRRSTGTNPRAASSRPSKRTGFTLVELLVSITILALVLSIVGVMVGTLSRAIGDTRKLLNSDDQARLIFIRMASDFSRMLSRKDVDVIFAKQTSGGTSTGANDSIYFVTQASGSNTAGSAFFSSSSANLLSLVGYCIAPDAQGTQISPTVNSTINDLNRLGHALTWDTANSSPDNLVFVSFAAPTTGSTSALITSTTLDGHWGTTTLGASPTYTPPTAGTNYGDYHALGDQVFRFEYCFLLKDGTYSNFPIMGVSTGVRYNLAGNGPPAPSNDNSDTSGTAGSVTGAYGYSPGSRWYDATDGRAFVCSTSDKSNAVWGPLGVQDVSAIIVAIALLDRDSRLRITSAATYNALPSFFADSLQGTTTSGTSLSTLPVSSATATASAASQSAPLVLMQQNWQATIDASGFATTVGLTTAAASHIRIYQRYFYLNANNL